jgi:hypothetical protein
MLSATEINSAIAARETDVERLRRELEIAEAKLRGMKELRDALLGPSATVALQAQTTVPTSSGLPKLGFRGGRQPGAISQLWRRILSDLYWGQGMDTPSIGATFDLQRVVSAAQKHGIRLRPSEAEARLSHYETFDYVGRVPDGFRVSLNAAIKFGFEKNPLKEEAPNAKAQEPHESLDPGDQTGAV